MLAARNLNYAYSPKRVVLADITLDLARGEVLGLSGASGSGKSTLAKLLAGHLSPSSGEVTAWGQGLGKGLVPVQYVHQAAIEAVNPRWRIGRIVEEAWLPDEEAREALGVSRSWYSRYPHEISGGELQRVVLLRALGPATQFLIADEATAMLDPITQAQVWTFLLQRAAQGLGILVISHDQALLDYLTPNQRQLSAGQLL